MKNKTTLLFSALAAAALLAGCETTQHNRGGRGAFGGGQSADRPARVRSTATRPAGVRSVAEQPSGVSEQPLAPVQPVALQPQPVVAQPQPVAQQPKPVVAQPQPATFQPQPVAQQPKPVVAQTQPVVATPQPQPVAQPQPAAVQAPAAPTFGTYKVKRGDVAGRIANSHGMTLKEFLDANNMTLEQANKLREGVNVKVWSNQEPLKAGPAVRPAQPVASDDPNVHVVKAGETLGSISAKTGVPVATLMKLNNIDNPNLIQEGRKLVLRTDAPATPTTAPKTVPATPTAAPTTPATVPAETKPEQPSKIRKTTKTPKQPEPAKPAGTAPVVAPASVPATTLVPAVAPAREPQDASVPNSEVKVDGTNASLEDLLGGMSLSEAREKAEEKKETAAKQLHDAATGAADELPEGHRYYIVQEGENLYHLGARFKVPFKTLRELNHLPPSTSKLEPGTRLIVPDTAP